MPENLEEIVIYSEDYESLISNMLTNRMFQELTSLYDGTADRKFPSLNFSQPKSVFIVAWIQGQPIACGAVVPLCEEMGEIKRMFVESAWRGRGVAKAVLTDLERRAQIFGYRSLRVETGIRQPTAIRLYQSAGYQPIAAYGCYVGNPVSVCFEKQIK
ncbi:GNAT family N-acetyltransferase [Nostoc sp. KVJ3]|uniref:GNAT family N-acetyltransferase n=1 Tax=Nostoc sp. KVJ3 TaxID=457945 RepID=UPI0022371022|nr:GNAT family N-acetyltransferase [Nostoc sp. KVJ3]MCW5316655.1 GNAT family N-acetyltransferase [Nostoc sp. KVJ3]